MKAKVEVCDIIQDFGKEFLQKHAIPLYKQKVLRDIANCRTAYFGGHKYQCQDCGQTRIQYNSCGNRHCPKCQHLERERWVRLREADLLPVKYYHVVFTVPHQLNSLFLKHQKQMYNLLFTTAWSVISSFANDPKHLGAKTAMTSVLHTWGQNMSFHPHLHCIVPEGGIAKDGKWKNGRGKGKYLYPVKAMSVVFRARFLEGCKAIAQKESFNLEQSTIDLLFNQPWVVYAKRPFKNVNTVLKYLARYTHRIAISNNRIDKVAGGRVCFKVKNYKNGGKKEDTSLSAEEFIRRFCLHILPARFRKIRHYGFLASRGKKENLATIRIDLKAKVIPPQKIDMKSILEEKIGHPIDLCPKCKIGTMVIVESYKENKAFNQLE